MCRKKKLGLNRNFPSHQNAGVSRSSGGNFLDSRTRGFRLGLSCRRSRFPGYRRSCFRHSAVVGNQSNLSTHPNARLKPLKVAGLLEGEKLDPVSRARFGHRKPFEAFAVKKKNDLLIPHPCKSGHRISSGQRSTSGRDLGRSRERSRLPDVRITVDLILQRSPAITGPRGLKGPKQQEHNREALIKKISHDTQALPPFGKLQNYLLPKSRLIISSLEKATGPLDAMNFHHP